MDVSTLVTIGLLLFGIGYVLRRGYRVALVGLYYALGGPDDAPEAASAEDLDEDGAPADDAPAVLDESPLAAAEWLELLNEEPSAVPHVAVCGPSGSGKSTFVLALIRHRAGQLVITTLKNAVDDPWGGFPAVRLAFRRDERGQIEPDWGPIGHAIDAVYQEVNARHADGTRPRTPLTLVVDELTATVAALGKGRMTGRLIHMWLTARSVNVRLIVMDPTTNVDGWGLTGRGDVRESIAFVRYERDKRAQVGSLEEVRADDGVPLDTRAVPALVAGELPADRRWAPPAPPAGPAPAVPDDDDGAEFSRPTSPSVTPYEVRLVAAWHAGGDTGIRSLARRLYLARGGKEGGSDGSGGPSQAVKAALSAAADGVSDETLLTA